MLQAGVSWPDKPQSPQSLGRAEQRRLPFFPLMSAYMQALHACREAQLMLNYCEMCNCDS